MGLLRLVPSEEKESPAFAMTGFFEIAEPVPSEAKESSSLFAISPFILHTNRITDKQKLVFTFVL